ncbi:sensor histidine kinase [Sanguibacter antarcticus]|uniref:histidine kinase n=1 Tax=Sanguibacter antarcticus TaxID=372484 RepID=A0A2A9E129_9MICO|nr:sensor domain-containing protein [Sanguibacter antarcticus]PFG32554.1 signal transduction histidine kinase [Sanguibacter antarcticus]
MKRTPGAAPAELQEQQETLRPLLSVQGQMTVRRAEEILREWSVEEVPPLERVGFWSAPFAARTWRELGYLTIVLVLSPLMFAYVVVAISLSAALLFTIFGWMAVLGVMVIGARGPGGVSRGLARGTLRARIATPRPFRRQAGFWPGVRAMLSDGPGWRALAHMTLELPLTVASFVISWTFLAASLGAMTHWFWGRYLPEQRASDGTAHRGVQLSADFFVDTPPRYVAFAIVGLLFLFVWAAVNQGLVHVHRLLAQSLLGLTKASARVIALEHARGHAVEDADATLRRIERDLHDGTQARLVAVAMQLGEARDHLRGGNGSPELSDLIESAHASTKDALVELREIARGIHPPALENGLAVALETLAARSPLPTVVEVDLPADPRLRPAKVIETITYFCVSELLTNAIKHAHATGLHVLVEEIEGSLHLRVRDDGVGGAVVLVPDAEGHHSGLAGLSERVRSVDGTFTLSSPTGGPTVVTIRLPLHMS